MNPTLLDKYNVPVPRYTSYPPANHFHGGFAGEPFAQELVRSNTLSPEHLSFYIHLPFCHQLCYYCGCNSFSMVSRAHLERYVAALHSEIDRVVEQLDRGRKIAQIHYGGGSPTSLPTSQLKALNDHLFSAFETIDRPEIAIECHPAYLRERDWLALTEAGFNRFSIGVQDFDTKVLEGVNRRPSLLPLEEIFALLRGAGARINLDFIYGLPRQSVASFEQSIRTAIALHPDRLVLFSYAHVPWVNENQRKLEALGLPSTELKQSLFAVGQELLFEAGYKAIGMDHFVVSTDELYQAKLTHQLHRNFQGYNTRRTTGQVYAFGASAISQLTTCYTQNEKDPLCYVEAIERGEWATVRGYLLSSREQIIREVIETLMCNNRIHWGELAERLSLSVEALQEAVSYSEAKMEEFQNDGLLSFDSSGFEMSPQGEIFVRNVASSFDPLMQSNPQNFSKPI